MLVFGSTGFLGKTFVAEQTPVTAVGRDRHDFAKPITAEFRAFLKTNRTPWAVVCTAISSPDDCLRKPEFSEAVNVTGTIAVLRELKELGIKPVFLSSDHVFNGKTGFYREDDAYDPITLYGKHKAKAETFVRENFADYLILRTSKQLAMRVDPKNLLSEMALKLRAGQNIRCATDSWLTPAFAEDIVRVTLQALQAGLSGIFHVAPEKVYSRLELGHEVADCMGVARSFIQPCSMGDFKFPEVRPPRCTLNGEKLRSRLGFQFTGLRDGLLVLKNGLG